MGVVLTKWLISRVQKSGSSNQDSSEYTLRRIGKLHLVKTDALAGVVLFDRNVTSGISDRIVIIEPNGDDQNLPGRISIFSQDLDIGDLHTFQMRSIQPSTSLQEVLQVKVSDEGDVELEGSLERGGRLRPWIPTSGGSPDRYQKLTFASESEGSQVISFVERDSLTVLKPVNSTNPADYVLCLELVMDGVEKMKLMRFCDLKPST